ncbi:MAG TPA: DUF4232 domain-containing protein [Micromonosporaceae bacterium]|nr:DUF4232 domain-containing protein [Micromonosporaceae bacterium]
MSTTSRAAGGTLASLGLVCAAAALAGCRSAAARSPDPVPTHSATSSALVAKCEQDGVTVSVTGEEAGLGNRAVVLIFTNRNDRACSMRGYPGVVALDIHGKQMAKAAETIAGYMGGVMNGSEPPDVVLPPGGSASAMVEALGFDQSDGSACTRYYTLVVSVPGYNGTLPSEVPWGNDGCSELQVHPVVPGVDGRA